MEIKYEICRISKKEADQILETGTHPEGLFFSEHDGRFIGISTTYHSIVSSEQFSSLEECKKWLSTDDFYAPSPAGLVLVSSSAAAEIIENRKPVGQFYYYERNQWIGIDNSTGDAWTEAFPSYKACVAWFREKEQTYCGTITYYGTDEVIGYTDLEKFKAALSETMDIMGLNGYQFHNE